MLDFEVIAYSAERCSIEGVLHMVEPGSICILSMHRQSAGHVKPRHCQISLQSLSPFSVAGDQQLPYHRVHTDIAVAKVPEGDCE